MRHLFRLFTPGKKRESRQRKTAGPEIEPVRRVKSMLGVTRPRASLLKEGFPGGVAVRVMRGGRDSPGRFRSGRRIYPE